MEINELLMKINCITNKFKIFKFTGINWQTETGIAVLTPSASIDSLSLLNENKYLNLPLVHQNPSTNSLVFRPFASDEFSPEVHSTRYRCLASNMHGTITSPLVHVKAGNVNFILSIKKDVSRLFHVLLISMNIKMNNMLKLYNAIIQNEMCAFI